MNEQCNVCLVILDHVPSIVLEHVVKGRQAKQKSVHNQVTTYINIAALSCIITLHACARGKAIGLSVVIIVSTKIARSRVLGICAYCKHNQSVDIGEKLVYKGFELLKRAYQCYKSCIFCSTCLWFIDHTHSFSMRMLMRLRMLKLSVGKGRQVIKQLCRRVWQYYATVATERTGYVLYRALVLTEPSSTLVVIVNHREMHYIVSRAYRP